MSFFRQLLIFVLVPLTAWGGMPHIACRCSTGEIRLFCLRMSQSVSPSNSNASCCFPSSQNTTCGEARVAGGCCGTGKKSQNHPSCCAETCHCTPVILAADATLMPKIENLADVHRVELLPITICLISQPHITQVNLSGIDAIPLVPDDIVVLTGHWLI